MKHWILLAALSFAAFAAGGGAQPNDALVGTWKLVSGTDTTDKGETRDAYGQNPTGFLNYSADGRMMVVISYGGRKPLSVADYVSAPVEERAAAYATFLAYAGRYTYTGDKVIHHVEVCSIQNRVGADLVRSIVSLKGNRLTLRTPPSLKGGAQVTTELVWERMSGGS